jgi:hypothetical protein
MKKQWICTMAKTKKKKYHGHYERAKGDRVFQLRPIDCPKPVFSYDSWQAAKKDGWSHDHE